MNEQNLEFPQLIQFRLIGEKTKLKVKIIEKLFLNTTKRPVDLEKIKIKPSKKNTYISYNVPFLVLDYDEYTSLKKAFVDELAIIYAL